MARISNTDTLGSPQDKNSSSGGGGPTPIIHDPTTAPTSESGIACERLIQHEFDFDELPGLIEAVFPDKDKNTTIYRLPSEKAEMFVEALANMLDEYDLPPGIRKRCLRLLYRTCGHHGIMPKVLTVEANYSGGSLYRGGYADVWKGERRGQEVAVKVLRVYSNDALQGVVRKFCKEAVVWKYLRHPNVLPLIGVMVSEDRCAMVSKWMGHGDIKQFIKIHPNVDRTKLLVGVAEGLNYLHENETVHGDLKGANILINEAGNALLADFGLVQITWDPANDLSISDAKGGTQRWMSPELLDPRMFGLENFMPTERSDCYALGMVIYETTSGVVPFHEYHGVNVSLRVVRGEHPDRIGTFPDQLWEMTKRCWAYQPAGRPDIKDVLECLRAVSNSSGHPSPQRGGEMDTGGSYWGPPSGFPAAQNRTSSGTMMTKSVGSGGRESYQRGVVKVTVLKMKGCDPNGGSHKPYVTLRSGDEEHKTSRRPEQVDSGCGWPNEQFTFKATSDKQKIYARLCRHSAVGKSGFLGSGEIDIWRYLNPTDGISSSEVLLRFTEGRGSLTRPQNAKFMTSSSKFSLRRMAGTMIPCISDN